MPVYKLKEPYGVASFMNTSVNLSHLQRVTYDHVFNIARIVSIPVSTIQAASVNLGFTLLLNGKDLTQYYEIYVNNVSPTVNGIVSAINTAAGAEIAKPYYDRIIIDALDIISDYSCIYIYDERRLYENGPYLFENDYRHDGYMVPDCIVHSSVELLCSNFDVDNNPTLYQITPQTNKLIMSFDNSRFFVITLPTGNNVTPQQVADAINKHPYPGVPADDNSFDAEVVNFINQTTTTVRIIARNSNKMYISPLSTCLNALGLPASYFQPVVVSSGPSNLSVLSDLPIYPGYFVNDIVSPSAPLYSYIIKPKFRDKLRLYIKPAGAVTVPIYLCANVVSDETTVGVIRSSTDVVILNDIVGKIFSVIAFTTNSSNFSLRFVLTGDGVEYRL